MRSQELNNLSSPPMAAFVRQCCPLLCLIFLVISKTFADTETGKLIRPEQSVSIRLSGLVLLIFLPPSLIPYFKKQNFYVALCHLQPSPIFAIEGKEPTLRVESQ